MMYFLRKKKKKEKNRFFHENGKSLLEELIASCEGNQNPIRTFSSEQIHKATNYFDRSRTVALSSFDWYQGMLDDQPVLIRKLVFEDQQAPTLYSPEKICRDIAVSSMMSSHKNVLKLLGCCLEFRYPVLVCEYAAKGALTRNANLSQVSSPLPWNTRLKIAKEVAVAVTYLHTAFPRIIIHRDIKPENIFLDENWTAKLSSFFLSISIPEGESSVDDCVYGTTGFVEPDYMRTGRVTENVDVYNFGMTMLALLTGRHGFVMSSDGLISKLPDYVGQLVEDGQFTQVIDPTMLNGGNEVSEHQGLQMKAFAELALRCVGFRLGEHVPKMIDVAKELNRLGRSTEASSLN